MQRTTDPSSTAAPTVRTNGRTPVDRPVTRPAGVTNLSAARARRAEAARPPEPPDGPGPQRPAAAAVVSLEAYRQRRDAEAWLSARRLDPSAELAAPSPAPLAPAAEATVNQVADVGYAAAMACVHGYGLDLDDAERRVLHASIAGVAAVAVRRGAAGGAA